jgi:hypothetical protein
MMMPMDPFFTSANTKHYVPNDAHAELMAKVRAMPKAERAKWMHEMKWKPLHTRTKTEASVFKALMFEWNISDRARRRFEAEHFACDLNRAAAQEHCVVLHGHSGRGGHRSQSQIQGHKSEHNQQGPRRHFDRVYDPKHKRKRQVETSNNNTKEV